MKKTLKTVFLVILALFILSLLFTFYRMWGVKTGRLVRMPNGTYLTPTEFHKIYPPQNTVLPDKNKPEEVYAKFRQAIVAGNVDEALKYIAERKRGEYKSVLVKNLEIYKQLPEFGELKKGIRDVESIQKTYKYSVDKKIYDIELDKTWDGYWFIYGI